MFHLWYKCAAVNTLLYIAVKIAEGIAIATAVLSTGTLLVSFIRRDLAYRYSI
jgi:hypothetical protein